MFNSEMTKYGGIHTIVFYANVNKDVENFNNMWNVQGKHHLNFEMHNCISKCITVHTEMCEYIHLYFFNPRVLYTQGYYLAISRWRVI